jgi:alpha-L-fucosidase 2
VVEGARTAIIYLTAATNYRRYDDVSNNPENIVDDVLRALHDKDFDEVKAEHVTDYQTLFNRFDIDFGSNEKVDLPTNKRLNQFLDGDPQLIALYVQYGRYLMISSSREGTYPANLQGIWNDNLAPAWDSKYTSNINLEMNYWISEVTNLSETHEPLFRLIKDVAETGAVTARKHYNSRGWIIHHNTDLWRGTAPINNANHGIYLGCAGWLSHHLWEHYRYTQDSTFLADVAYPLMKGAALFYMDNLVEDPHTGWLVSSPSNSPETGGLVYGPAMDHQIIRSLIKRCIEAAEILQEDSDFAEDLKATLKKIAPDQIGKYGQLQEWVEDKDDTASHHRHVSHLWGIYPGEEINWDDNPDLMEAAKRSLQFRGDEGTGWSLAWKINFWARFLDGDHAYKLIQLLFRPVTAEEGQRMSGGGSYPNLFDAHPPFQIDGNFGAPAGIIEMLMQSHRGGIDLLPALPQALPQGFIKGVIARGAFELSFRWDNSRLVSVDVLSRAGNPCTLRYRDKHITFETSTGKEYHLNGELLLQ